MNKRIWATWLPPSWRYCIGLISHSQPDDWRLMMQTNTSYKIFMIKTLTERTNLNKNLHRVAVQTASHHIWWISSGFRWVKYRDYPWILLPNLAKRLYLQQSCRIKYFQKHAKLFHPTITSPNLLSFYSDMMLVLFILPYSGKTYSTGTESPRYILSPHHHSRLLDYHQ